MRNRLSSNEDEVVSAFHARDHRAKRFPQPAFNAIARDAVAYFFAHREANVNPGPPGLHPDQNQQVVGLGVSFAVYMAEFFVPLERITAFHLIAIRSNFLFVGLSFSRGDTVRGGSACCRSAALLRGGRRLRDFSRALPLRGKLLAAFVPSAGKHVAAVAGFHPLTETMNLLALPFLGLKCTKHRLHLFSIIDPRANASGSSCIFHQS